MNYTIKNLVVWTLVIAFVLSVLGNITSSEAEVKKLDYSEFVKVLKKDDVVNATVSSREVRGELKDGTSYLTYIPIFDNNLISSLLNSSAAVKGQPPQQENLLLQIFISWFPMLLLIGVWWYFMSQMQGGGKGAMNFGRSKAKLLGEDKVKITFADVAGVDEAKEELKEMVDYLKEPTKFQKLGGKLPRGVLMVGNPGTGKTLLARAIAGEAKVPFFNISGSDFVEMFVGVGASRVRDMFEQAKKQAPCIIFIDEIDSVGRKRGSRNTGSHDEREQTLNQLLVEMDGFDGKEGIIVVAATNRPDVLDNALLRPGRFDRQVEIPLPDIKGREQILAVHMRKVPTETDIDITSIARGTPGFSGAELANLVNESALIAVKKDHKKVSMEDLDDAKDKIIMGVAKKSSVMDEQERNNTAYHEAGHAIVGLSLPEHDPLYKVTIIPRGRALGVTMFLPEKDKYSNTRAQLENQIAVMYGGRVAEELIFGDAKVTTGASNDIHRATQIATDMVIKWGLSKEMGPQRFQTEEGGGYFGGYSASSDYSPETLKLIDKEIKAILTKGYNDAKKILQKEMQKLHTMAESLIKYETLEKPQIDAIMAGETEISPPKGW